MIGVVALQTGDTHSARSLIERALRIDTDDAAAYMALGNVAEAESNLDAAYTEHSRVQARPDAARQQQAW